jgi:myo-inositol 2-dehydrogenase/D-chiro-inositol 1-dehydrogenase
MKENSPISRPVNRRIFLKSSGAAVIGSATAFSAFSKPATFGKSSNTLKVGLVGCGGRGTGAASQALSADPDVVLTAMGDIFQDHLDASYNNLLEIHPDKVKVSKENKFIGFDAYKRVIESDVDVVLLTTPPGFRPDHLAAAVDAGKHTFCEKPMAVDAPGVRKLLAAAKKAKEKKLSMVSGYCLRHDYGRQAIFGKVLKGEIGDISTITTVRNGGELWYKTPQPGWTKMENQLRNWYYYNWLSGDFIVEMIVHSLDMMAWAMGDKTPVRATGTGGRQARIDPKFGNIYDHFAIEFEYDNGVKAYNFCRQHNDCSTKDTVEIMGTAGKAFSAGDTQQITTGKKKWQYQGEKNNMFQTEHDVLFASIRKGEPLNDGEKMANSSMLGIFGRMVAYSGQTLTWHEALNSNQVLGPATDQYSWDLDFPGPDIARPGVTKVL